MADSKTSDLPELDGADLVATDKVIVLDRSDTSGTGSGPNGTLKQMEASRLASFSTTKGIVYSLNLVGIDTSTPLFFWASQAINAYGPYQGNPGEDLYFRAYQVSGQQNNYSITITYLKLISGRLVAGGAGNTISPSELTLSGGPLIINAEVNADLFLEIGDAGAGPISTYFNLGKNHDDTDPWEINGEIFLTGVLDGDPTIWQFLGGDGNWGGTSGNDAIPDYFVNLSLQPFGNGYDATKLYGLSLYNIDTTQEELKYIADAVKEYGPFTSLPGQQMVFRTKVLVSGGGVGGSGSQSVVTRYYRLLRNITSIGGPLGIDVLPSFFMQDGNSILQEVTDVLIVELGDIGTSDVETAFNLGDSGEAWDMNEYRFVRATQDSSVTLWAFVGIEGMYGGDDLGTDPDIFEAVAADFFKLTDQPTTITDGDNIKTTKTVLNTDLATEDAAGLATYYNALDPGVLKQGYESWRINIVDDSDDILKTFDLMDRGKGIIGDGSALPPLVAANFFEINTVNLEGYQESGTIADMLADQATQITYQNILVIDASDDTNITFPVGETKLQATYRYNGVATGDISDYTLMACPYGNGGENEIPTLQDVTNEGNVTSKSIVIGNSISNILPKTFKVGGSVNMLQDNAYGESNLIVSDGNITTYNNLYGNIIAGNNLKIGTLSADLPEAISYDSLLIGSNNNLYSAQCSAMIGAGLLNGSSASIVIGVANEDLTTTIASFTTAEFNNLAPRFIVGVGSINIDSGSSIIRKNGFVVMSDGAVSAPSLTNALINTTGAKALTTKEYVDRKEIKTISATTYTLLETDNNKILQFTSATDVTITVPTGLTLGNRFEGKQRGEGQLIFVGDTGVTVNVGASETNKTLEKFSVWGLDCCDTDEYDLFGKLELV